MNKRRLLRGGVAPRSRWRAHGAVAERREGASFNLCRFHDTVLSYGPIPVPTVQRLYFDHVAPTATMPASRCE